MLDELDTETQRRDYHKVAGQDECYQSRDGRITVQIFRWRDEPPVWHAFVDGRKMFSEFPTKEKAIAGAERKAYDRG